MLRIEILFDRETAKNMKAGTLQALRGEIERRLSSTHPEIWLRIEKMLTVVTDGIRNTERPGKRERAGNTGIHLAGRQLVAGNMITVLYRSFEAPQNDNYQRSLFCRSLSI